MQPVQTALLILAVIEAELRYTLLGGRFLRPYIPEDAMGVILWRALVEQRALGWDQALKRRLSS